MKDKIWIDVNEKMPNSDTNVLICLHTKFIRTSYFFKDSFGEWFSTSYNIWDQEYTGSVTHWMPLPKLP